MEDRKIAKRLKRILAKVRKTEPEVELLVSQAMRGDQKSLVSLCFMVAPDILFSTRYYINNLLDAEEAMQKVVASVCDKIGTLKDVAKFNEWLHGIIINIIKQYQVKSIKDIPIVIPEDYQLADGQEAEDEGGQVLDYEIDKEDRTTVMEILSRLPELQQKAIFLYYSESFSITQVASIMDITVLTAEHYLTLAKGKIKVEITMKTENKTSLYELSQIPMSRVLFNLFRQEKESFSKTIKATVNLLVENTTAKYIRASSVRLSGVSMGLVETATLTLVISIIVALGIGIIGAFLNPKENDMKQPDPVETSGEITFLGASNEINNLNPESAKVFAENERGVLTIERWSISLLKSEDIIYFGEGDSLNEILIAMYQKGMDGEYILSFLMIDSEGATCALTRQFIINTG